MMRAGAALVATVGFRAAKRLMRGRLRYLPCPLPCASRATAGTEQGLSKGYCSNLAFFLLFSQKL